MINICTKLTISSRAGSYCHWLGVFKRTYFFKIYRIASVPGTNPYDTAKYDFGLGVVNVVHSFFFLSLVKYKIYYFKIYFNTRSRGQEAGRKGRELESIDVTLTSCRTVTVRRRLSLLWRNVWRNVLRVQCSLSKLKLNTQKKIDPKAESYSAFKDVYFGKEFWFYL